MKLNFLSSPYSNNPEENYNAVLKYVKLPFTRGHIFSPILHWHPSAKLQNVAGTFDFWLAYDFNVLRRCDELMVLTIPGWKESIGVRAEIQLANQLGLPINYLHYDPRIV